MNTTSLFLLTAAAADRQLALQMSRGDHRDAVVGQSYSVPAL